MSIFPMNVGIVPAFVIGDPKTETLNANQLFDSGVGIEFEEAVGIRVYSTGPFFYAFADTDIQGSSKTLNNAVRGYRGRGIWIFAFYNELRKFYLRAEKNNTIMTVERLQSKSGVEEEDVEG